MKQHHSGYKVVVFRNDIEESYRWMPFDEALLWVKRLEQEMEDLGLFYYDVFDCWHCVFSDGRSLTVRIEIHDSLGQAVLSGGVK